MSLFGKVARKRNNNNKGTRDKIQGTRGSKNRADSKTNNVTKAGNKDKVGSNNDPTIQIETVINNGPLIPTGTSNGRIILTRERINPKLIRNIYFLIPFLAPPFLFVKVEKYILYRC